MREVDQGATLLELGNNLLDPMWRLNNLYWITDKDGQKVLFHPNAAQLEFINGCSDSDVILKARQLGFTTLASIIGLDEALFFENWHVGIIADTRENATKIFETKVKYPYKNLPRALRRLKPAKNDRAGFLNFEHDSSIGVTTSARSGTLQRLHVSEFGKICAKYPQKAREIVTGSFPAVGKNPKTIESTAEGQEGYFYDYCTDAMVGRGGFKFHFFPWWQDPNYVSHNMATVISAAHQRYFEKLEAEIGRKLTDAQKRWWVEQEYLLGGDMKRENPATPKEAFEQAIEGAYFATQLAHSEMHRKIGRFPVDTNYPVNTWWDLGRNDMTAIWLHQFIDGRNRLVGYYENSGEHISHYVMWLKSWARQNGVEFDTHYWPHDGKREDLFLENGRQGEAEKLGLYTEIVTRTPNKMEAITTARSIFPSCDFDEEGCAQGLKRLKHYRKEWDENRDVWKNQPRHDDNSHGADAFMTFSTGWVPPVQVTTQFTPRKVV